MSKKIITTAILVTLISSCHEKIETYKISEHFRLCLKSTHKAIFTHEAPVDVDFAKLIISNKKEVNYKIDNYPIKDFNPDFEKTIHIPTGDDLGLTILNLESTNGKISAYLMMNNLDGRTYPKAFILMESSGLSHEEARKYIHGLHRCNHH
ncbi:MAG: hypothetical protein Q4B94_08215 [Pseudomonadota bacterium]|nr:hypothetical protein [Pseudomonadota bacterium]